MLRISTKERLGIFVNYYNHDSILPILLIKRILRTPPQTRHSTNYKKIYNFERVFLYHYRRIEMGWFF
jgi:hypothetical protein